MDLNKIPYIPGNNLKDLSIPRKRVGFVLLGLCQKCDNKNICILLNHIGKLPIMVFEGEFELQVNKCKFSTVKEDDKND